MEPASDRRQRSRSLTTRVTVTVLAFGAAMLAAYLFLVHLPLCDTLRAQDEVRGKRLFQDISLRLQKKLESVVHELEELAKDPAIRSLVAVDVASRLRQAEYGQDELKFYVMDRDRRFIAYPSHCSRVEAVCSSHPYIISTIASGAPTFDKVRPDRSAARPSASVIIAVPIAGPNGSSAGLLAGRLRVSGQDAPLRRLISRGLDPQRYRALLLDPDGFAIADSEESTSYASGQRKRLDNRAHPFFCTSCKQLGQVRTLSYSFRGQQYLGHCQILPGTNWRLILQGRLDPVLATAKSVVSGVGWTLIGLLVVMLGGVLFYVSRVVGPTQGLTRGLVEFGRTGQATEVEASHSSGEIKRAISAFHEMIAERKLFEAELLQQRRELHALAVEFVNVERHMRHELAQDFHADIAQHLASAKVHLEVLQDRQTSEAREKTLEVTLRLLEDCIRSTKAMTQKLTNPTLHHAGLVTAIRELVTFYQEHHEMEFGFADDQTEPPIDDAVAETLFRGVRELLQNIVKHAGAEHAFVSIKQSAETLEIEIRDDGTPIGEASLAQRQAELGRFGMLSFSERVRQLGGCVKVEGDSPRGCRVTVVVPLDEPEPTPRGIA